MKSHYHAIRRQLILVVALLLPMFTILFSTNLLNASANNYVSELSPAGPNLARCDGGGPTNFAESMPLGPEALELLVAYDFDEGQVVNQMVDNTIVPRDVNWMTGLISGDPQLKYILNTYPGNRALLLNTGSDPLDFVSVNFGETQGFTAGINVAARICFDGSLNKPAYIIASQMVNEIDGEASWRLSIDRTNRNFYALIFTVWFESGSSAIVKYNIPSVQPGQWINVAGSYDYASKTVSVSWNQQVVQKQVSSSQVIKAHQYPIRIGLGSGTSFPFIGMMDEVRIWGDKPNCYDLTTQTDPSNAGSIMMIPLPGQTPFCDTPVEKYAVGELVQLEANPLPESDYHFYKWKGDINYIQGSQYENPITILVEANTDIVADFLEQAEAPTLTLFPIFGLHNISVDQTCDGESCDLACGLEAQALSNDYCHEAAEDIFADIGTPVVAAQSGTILFGCEITPGNYVNIYDGNDIYTYGYSHLDRVCFRDEDSTNICGANYEPGAEITCTTYFENGDYVMAGQQIGTVGKSGSAISTNPHLHFATIPNGIASCAAMNPYPFLYELEPSSCADYVQITDFRAEPAIGSAPLNVDFDWDIIVSPGRENIICELDFGDGTAPYVTSNCLTNQGISHTYLTQGVHTAVLTVSFPGTYVTAELQIRVAKWISQSSGDIHTSPALTTTGTISTLYYTVMGDLFAVNATNGLTKWEFPTSGIGNSSPVVGSDGTVYFATNSHLYAVYPDDGSEMWSFAQPEGMFGDPVIGSAGTLYIPSYGMSGCFLYAISEGQGSQLLQLGTTETCNTSNPIVSANGTIYIWSYDDGNKQLLAISPSGNIQWTYDSIEAGYGTDPIFNAVGQIVIMEGNKLRGIDAQTGIVVWTNIFPFSASVSASPAMASDGTIYIVDSQGFLHATYGSLLRWSIDIDGTESSPAIDSNSNIYVGSNNNKLYAISYGGSVLWSFATGGGIESSPTMGGGAIYVGSNDGSLYAIESDAVLNSGPWPKYRHDLANSGHGQ